MSAVNAACAAAAFLSGARRRGVSDELRLVLAGNAVDRVVDSSVHNR